MNAITGDLVQHTQATKDTIRAEAAADGIIGESSRGMEGQVAGKRSSVEVEKQYTAKEDIVRQTCTAK